MAFPSFLEIMSSNASVTSSVSQALLKNRDSAASLGPFDGNVAAVIGKFLYTTPNSSFIPFPSSGHRDLHLRNDYRYGPDDPTLWPQPYSERSPHLGLIARIPNDVNNPLHFLVGNVAAVIGKFLYTTPNSSFIPFPSSGHRDLHLRNDYRYGPDDPTLWPQPYSERSPHLGLIARIPNDVNNPLHFLVWNPTPNDFVASTGIANGVGRLAQQRVNTLASLVNRTRSRFSRYVAQLGDKKPNPVATLLNTAIHHTLTRLQSLPATYTQLNFGVTELQRYILELDALLDYVEIFKPIMDGAPPVSDSIQRMGVYTSNPRVVQDFHHAGLPVWYVRDFKATADGFINNILEIVEPTQFSSLIATEKHTGFPSIFSGKADTAEIIDLIHGYSRRWLATPNPFDVPSLLNPASASPAPVQIAELSLSSRPTKRPKLDESSKSKSKAPAPGSRKPAKQKNEPKVARDTFAVIESPLAPFAIPSWAAALREVDQSTPPATDPLPPYARMYAYPDPGIFITVPAERRQRLLESWLRIADASRATRSSFHGMKIQQWRDLLFIDFTSPISTQDEASTFTAKQ
ncbi:hypothetical protein CVT24_000269 [Panaeolus cyanescens]|uniref:Uncharacterized protein n=1 Tax=Panaeolus cyanescens TaxID=181874 RepID=A0A409YD79_9AGAR|nr:hypothetical protein CVT24_000269 [Panaeolus cyanescens]